MNGSPLTGTFVYSPAAGVVLGGGLHTLSATFTPTDATDYSTGRATVTLQVSPVTPTISWTPTRITYGTALSVIQLNAKATYNNGMAAAGTYLYDPPAGTVLTAGAQTLSVTFTPTSSANFNSPAPISVTLQVNQATPKITWTAPAAITYGTALSAERFAELPRDSPSRQSCRNAARFEHNHFTTHDRQKCGRHSGRLPSAGRSFDYKVRMLI